MRKTLSDKELLEFMQYYKSNDSQAIKKFTAKKLIKYANFLRHYTPTLSDGTVKKKEHTEEEILQSLFVLFNVG